MVGAAHTGNRQPEGEDDGGITYLVVPFRIPHHPLAENLHPFLDFCRIQFAFLQFLILQSVYKQTFLSADAIGKIKRTIPVSDRMMSTTAMASTTSLPVSPKKAPLCKAQTVLNNDSVGIKPSGWAIILLFV